MEFLAPIYKRLYDCEQKGMHLPRGWDLMLESDLITACDEFDLKYQKQHPEETPTKRKKK